MNKEEELLETIKTSKIILEEKENLVSKFPESEYETNPKVIKLRKEIQDLSSDIDSNGKTVIKLQKERGKEFISDTEIDNLIDKIIKEETK